MNQFYLKKKKARVKTKRDRAHKLQKGDRARPKGQREQVHKGVGRGQRRRGSIRSPKVGGRTCKS